MENDYLGSELINDTNEQLLTLLPVPIALLAGPEHVVSFANAAMFDLWKRQLSDPIIGKPLTTSFPETDQAFLAQLQKVYLTGESYQGEEIVLQLNDRHGKPYTTYVDYSYKALRDKNNQITGILVNAIDVSQKILAKQAAIKSTQDLELANEALGSRNEECLMAIETAKLGTWKYKLTSNKVNFSARTSEIYGFTSREATIDQVFALIDEAYRAEVELAIDNALETGHGFELEYSIVQQGTGATRWLRTAGRTAIDRRTREINLHGTVMDITAQKMELIRKNEFIGMVSHELKTPLTSLNGLLQHVQKRIVPAQDELFHLMIGKTLQQVKKMSTMVHSFLNISRLESGKFELQPSEFNMAELIAEHIEEAAIVASQHHLIQQECETSLVCADREKISVILANLISNAVKYSPHQSTIAISCKQVRDQLIVCAKDEGCAIPEHELKHVFDLFNAIKNKEVMNAAGFGIGLYLCSEIVKRHGGEIWVKNNEDVGCTFSFSLPLQASDTAITHAATTQLESAHH
jgi:two-component system sensor histidine kinase VicK